ncbi:MAG: hypothetical protein LUC98_02925 [Lachnospiraceae bacterium]|nr:hypothetical protein [Lachnospiraceae bacterium]
MNQDEWVKHIVRQSDFTLRLTHLTRRTDNMRAIDVLFQILDEKCLRASDKSGFIRKNNRAVCLQEHSLYSLAENILFEDEKATLKYEAFGLRFNKGVLFQKGARPAIYGTEEELDQIPENLQWRCIRMDISDSNKIVDWSHEREWRYNGDLMFEYSDIEVILGCGKSYREFIERYKESTLLSDINGIIVLDSLLK